MFSNFSFQQTASRHPSVMAPDSFDDDFESMSPLSDAHFPPQAYTPPVDALDYSISDLSRQLSHHSLNQQSPPSPYTLWRKASIHASIADLPTPPNEAISPRTLSPAPPDSGRSSPPPSYLNHSSTSIRQQRQRAIRRQCSSSHLREISELVSRMVQDRDQCCFRSPAETPTSAPSPVCDEYPIFTGGSVFSSEPVDDMDVEHDASACSSGSEDGSRARSMKYRRANDATSVRVGKSTVTKETRVRKRSGRKASVY